MQKQKKATGNPDTPLASAVKKPVNELVAPSAAHALDDLDKAIAQERQYEREQKQKEKKARAAEKRREAKAKAAKQDNQDEYTKAIEELNTALRRGVKQSRGCGCW